MAGIDLADGLEGLGVPSGGFSRRNVVRFVEQLITEDSGFILKEFCHFHPAVGPLLKTRVAPAGDGLFGAGFGFIDLGGEIAVIVKDDIHIVALGGLNHRKNKVTDVFIDVQWLRVPVIEETGVKGETDGIESAFTAELHYLIILSRDDDVAAVTDADGNEVLFAVLAPGRGDDVFALDLEPDKLVIG